MEQRPSGKAAIIITHFLLVGGAHPYTKPVYLFATNRPQVSVDSGGELLHAIPLSHDIVDLLR